jgi:hypothetical protein
MAVRLHTLYHGWKFWPGKQAAGTSGYSCCAIEYSIDVARDVYAARIAKENL